MSRLRMLLILVICVEVLDITWIRNMQGPQIPLPEVNLEKLTTESRESVTKMVADIDRSSSHSWISLAEILRLHGYFPESAYCYEQAASMDKLSGDSLYFWGICLSQMGQLQESRSKLLQAIQAETHHKTFCFNAIAMSDLRDENPVAAEDSLIVARKLPLPRLFYARMLIRMGRAKEAQVLVDEALEQVPDSIRFRQMKSWVERALGSDEEADRFADLAERGVQRIFHDGDPAVEEMQRIDKLLRNDTYFQTSKELADAGHVGDAITVMRLALQSENWEGYAAYLASLERIAGKPREAIAVVEATMDKSGVSAPLLLELGLAYQDLEMDEEARETFERGKQLAHLIELYQYLEMIYTRANDLDRAKQNRGMAAYMFGKEAWLLDDLETARGHLEVATELVSDYDHAWFYLAETYRHLDLPSEADKAYQRCLEVNPLHGRAIRGYERLNRSRGPSGN